MERIKSRNLLLVESEKKPTVENNQFVDDVDKAHAKFLYI